MKTDSELRIRGVVHIHEKNHNVTVRRVLQVDVHIMTKPPAGDWVCLGTGTTDSGGRLTFTVPEEKRVPQGMYPVKMVVR